MKSHRILIPVFLLILVSGLYAQTSIFSVMGNYRSSFEFKPGLRLTNAQNTRNLFGGVVILETLTPHLSWGGGFRVRYKCVDSYVEDIVDDADSLTGQTVEFKDQLTFIELFGTGSVALMNTQHLRLDFGVDLGIIAVDRNFALGDGALNMDLPIELMPWLRIRLFPRNEIAPVMRFGYLLANPYAETRITKYTENEAIVKSYKEKTRLTGFTLEAGIIYRF